MSPENKATPGNATPGAAPLRTDALEFDDVRDKRYAEFLLIGQKTAVYNTVGLNDCPLDKFKALDAKALAKQFQVPAVFLNGPRFWTMDHIFVYQSGDTASFGGIEARLVATFTLPPGAKLGAAAYTDVPVERTTRFVFSAGKPIYTLLSPDGHLYAMQAYSHIVDDTLTTASLPNLATRLKLPKGWLYLVTTPDQDLHVQAVAGLAHIVQDDFENTYQRIDSTS
jgi:hypothetical protein